MDFPSTKKSLIILVTEAILMNAILFPFTVTKTSAETKQFSKQHSNRKSVKDNQINRQMPKMTPHSSTQPSPSTQQSSAATQQPSQAVSGIHHHQQQQHQQQQSAPQSHQTQMQPHWQMEYAPAHMEPGMQHPHGYHVLPSLYFSNFTANVNVHGYTQAMQPSYLHQNSQPYMPTDGQQNAVEQVR